VVGKTGEKKTTYTAFQTQLYDRDKSIEEPLRLNASIPAAEAILFQMRDCTRVLDDLFPTEGDTKRHQEKTLTELTRIIGDKSGRARMSGNEVVTKEPQCGVIVTGEYLVGTGSTAARLLPVKFTNPIDHVKLSECQREPLVLSTFYRYYITWYIENYYEIQDLLATWLLESRRVNLGVHARLQESLFCLESAYKLFLHYCVAKGFASLETAKAQHSSFRKLLLDMVRQQDKRVNQQGKSEADKPEYLKIIGTLYNGKSIRLADSAERFKSKHDGLIYYDCLCIPGAKLMEKVRAFVPAAKLDDIIDELLAQKALKIVNDKDRTVQIHGCGGRRFYAVKLKKLK
jgi:hypothetical protein